MKKWIIVRKKGKIERSYGITTTTKRKAIELSEAKGGNLVSAEILKTKPREN